MRGRLVVGLMVAQVGLLVAAAAAPAAVLADCPTGASDCVQLDATEGSPGDTIGLTVVATCEVAGADLLFDPETDQTLDDGRRADVRPAPSGAEGAYEFEVPDVAAGSYEVWFECQGLDTFVVEPAFVISMGSPNTSTADVTSPSGSAAFAIAAAALSGLLGGLIALAWLGRRRRQPRRRTDLAKQAGIAPRRGRD